jgi:hypothetical protein
MAEHGEPNATNVGKLSMKIVELLVSEDSETRVRAVDAALLILGEVPLRSGSPGSVKANFDAGIGREEGNRDLHSRAMMWLRQNDISSEQLVQVFHSANGVTDFIGSSIPGQSERDRTCNAYVLLGIARLLDTGVATFEDKAARELCRTLGCYDNTNHATYLIKGRGNNFTGSKERGWTLTAPGLAYGASLVKELAKK